METDLTNVKHRARRAYEWARVLQSCRRCAVLAIPLLLAVSLAGPDRRHWVLAITTWLVAWLAWFSGRSAGRSVWIGVAGGGLVFAAGYLSSIFDISCALGVDCSDWCFAACSGAGGLAGLLIGLHARRLERPLEGAIAGAAIALAAGAMGCTCVGMGGVIGAALGLLVMTVPTLVWGRVGARR